MSLFLISNAMAMSIILALNPMTMSIWILLTALFFALTLASSSASWFGLILFIIYISGMLVMFSYFVAIQPNQHLEVFKIIILSSLSSFLLFLLSNFLSKPSIHIFNQHKISPFLLLSLESSSLFFILASSLFLTLIVVVKISNLSQGPLRPFS
uniref:NADH dehydrogenase subunit 6 n=1 Tax=Diopatra cuprea TaxID=398472 RepID=UPI001D1050E0|nr:NADH dehydrogenase subunit 6 [Diopatra cuprea]QZM06624.1 NADH dehydrogenase subunit 6 [Diopatra cuprea]